MFRVLFGIITVFDVAAVGAAVRRLKEELHCCLFFLLLLFHFIHLCVSRVVQINALKQFHSVVRTFLFTARHSRNEFLTAVFTIHHEAEMTVGPKGDLKAAPKVTKPDVCVFQF